MVAYITAAYAESPPLNPTPNWLHPPQDGKDTDGDVVSEPYSPEEVVRQFRRMCNTAPGVDGLTYATWTRKEPSSLISTTSAGQTPGFHRRDSRREKYLLLAWLDIKDAFPSVSHHLMLFLMERLGLSGSVLQEGCPLSLILFNVVIEGLLRHLSASQGGYSIAGYNINTLVYANDVCVIASSKTVVQDIYSHATVAIRTGRESHTHPIPQCQGGYSIAGYNINTFVYANDVCVIASSKTVMQSLLDQCAEFGDWSSFRFNAKKCGSMCMVNQAPRINVDCLFTPHLGGDIITTLTWAEWYRYLGCPTGAFRTRDQDLDSVKEDLLRDTSAIFKSRLAEWQKLNVFRWFIFPRLTFISQVIFPGPFGLWGLGCPQCRDEAHIAKAAQAFEFLGDTRDPVIRAVALQQVRATVATRARKLDPTKKEDLEEFLNTTAAPGEGRTVDLQSLWSSARAGLANGGATIEITADSAVLHMSRTPHLLGPEEEGLPGAESRIWSTPSEQHLTFQGSWQGLRLPLPPPRLIVLHVHGSLHVLLPIPICGTRPG
ncbi:hypothetical protein EMCRGX_G005519 [Ephydatia muelleri]